MPPRQAYNDTRYGPRLCPFNPFFMHVFLAFFYHRLNNCWLGVQSTSHSTLVHTHDPKLLFKMIRYVVHKRRGMGNEIPRYNYVTKDCETLLPASPPDGRAKTRLFCDSASKPGGFVPSAPVSKSRAKLVAVWEGSETTTSPVDLW